MIGDILKQTRNIYGYKAREMCLLLDISPSYLSEIENNKKSPSLELLQKYADIYDLKLSSLILLSEEFDQNALPDKPSLFVRKLMIRLVNAMSEDENETTN